MSSTASDLSSRKTNNCKIAQEIYMERLFPIYETCIFTSDAHATRASNNIPTIVVMLAVIVLNSLISMYSEVIASSVKLPHSLIEFGSIATSFIASLTIFVYTVEVLLNIYRSREWKALYCDIKAFRSILSDKESGLSEKDIEKEIERFEERKKTLDRSSISTDDDAYQESASLLNDWWYEYEKKAHSDIGWDQSVIPEPKKT